MKSKNVIELNGTRYDSQTGTVVGAGSAPAIKTAQNIDGFFRSRATTPAKPSAPKPGSIAVHARAAAKPSGSRAINHAVAHRPEPARTIATRAAAKPQHVVPVAHKAAPGTPNHVRPHHAQPSVTLMRAAVRKPAPGFKQQATIQASLQHKVPSLIVPKLSATNIQAGRMARATTVSRSPQIVHHNDAGERVAVTVTPVAVRPEPTVSPEEGAPAPQPTNKPLDMFEQAVANASHFVDTKTHQLHFKKQARRHVASMAAGALALVVIAGFAAYQNTPGLQFKVASIQAGVATNMPNFKAAGFAYNGVKANNGKLVVGFSGNNGQYTLVQQTTNLSGSDMIQSVSATDASGTPNYKAVQAGNTTVYRFDNTSATWISGGKWYTVTGNNALSSSQLTSLVKNS